MNLPTEINFGPNHKILYLYDANGRKLKKQVIHNAQSHHTDYSGAFQYEDGFLTLILTPEGRIVKHSSTYDPQYFLKDYLGNVRVVYHANPETGMVEVVQEDHYDPFGMKLGGLGYVSDIESKYLFQGKEFNDEAIDTDSDGNTDTYMNWYDFEARQFDPQIGRWHVADPLAQYPSPYVGMGNNPVSLVDPNGMATIWSLEEETTLWYTMAIDSRIHSRHVSYNNSEPLHTAYTEELISRRGAIEISGGSASGDWKAEKLALFYYTQELRRQKAEMDKILAYLNEPGPKDNEAMDELASMIQNASSTGLSFGGPKGKWINPNCAGGSPYNSGEIRQWNPSLMDLWSESEGFLGKLTYNLVDGISVTLQSFVRGPEARHLNGSDVAGNDRTDAFVNTTSWALSTSGFLKSINSNNWLRIGWGYDKGDEVFRVAWGAGRNHVKDISNPTLREFNIRLRQLGNGHWDIWRP